MVAVSKLKVGQGMQQENLQRKGVRDMFQILKQQKGIAVVMLALILPAVIGFAALVVDVGNLYLNKTQVTVISDAAVFAAAQELPQNPTQADAVARDYAARNGKPTDTVTVTISSDHKSISVKVDRQVTLFFAVIFNKNSSKVTAKSTAQISIAASVPWIVPFVLPKTQVFDYTHQFTMRMYNAKNPYGTYEFDYMNIGIQNANFNDYITYLKYGYQQSFAIGNNVQYLGPSSGGKASVEAFYDRTQRDPNTDYTKAKVGDPRVMLIPLVTKMLSRTTSVGTPMQIIGFVGFFLDEVHKGVLQPDGNYGITFYAKGHFLQDLNVGSGDSTSNPVYDFGVRTIKLTE